MATRCYFNHCAVQRRTRKPEAAGDDKLVIRLILERVSGSLVWSAGEFIVETSTPLAEKEIWADFCRIKQFSSDASIESEYAEMMAESLSSIGVPEAKHAAIIESVFVAVDAAVSSKLPLDVGLWDVTYRLQLNDGCRPNVTPAAKSSIEGLEQVELQHDDDDLRQTCALCLVDFAAQDQDQLVLTRLPCSHLYHLDCIVQCLEINHLCPMCRYPMPTEDQAES